MPFMIKPVVDGLLYEAAVRFAADYKQGLHGSDPLVDMGWSAAIIPENYGGLGVELSEVVSVIDALAQYGVHLPVIERCLLAPVLLQGISDQELRGHWLGSVAQGRAVVAAIVNSEPDLGAGLLKATQQGGATLLDGQIVGVTLDLQATHGLVVAELNNTPALFLIQIDQLGAPVDAFRRIDGGKSAGYRFEKQVIPSESLVARGEAVINVLKSAQRAALLGVGVDTVGTMASILLHTIEYLKNRKQFDVALSSFQVLRHRVVDMYSRYESARGIVQECLDNSDINQAAGDRSLSLMKLCLGEAGRFIAESGIQLHGGMGMSEETLVARLAQRLLTNEYRYGDRSYHVDQLRLMDSLAATQ
jgi:alkylation response protein AidB-like acyl-CoA dehydrogenase